MMEATSSSASPKLFCEEALSGLEDVDETTQAVPGTPQQSGTDSDSSMLPDDGSLESVNEVAAEEPGPSKVTPVCNCRRRSYVSNFLTGKARLVVVCSCYYFIYTPPNPPSISEISVYPFLQLK